MLAPSSGLLRVGLSLKLNQIKLATRSYLRDRTNQATATVASYAVAVGLFVVAGIFIYAGAIKAFDPVQFAGDVDNYKVLPWPVSVALAFYLPWLEIFCALALIVRFFYRGALSILGVLILLFTLATIAAKVRGLDITCGCFGHASQHWSFPAHLMTNLAILAALLILLVQSVVKHRVTQQQPSG